MKKPFTREKLEEVKLPDKVVDRVLDNQEGVKAIVHLQSLVDIEESEENALKGWLSMSASEKEHTMKFYTHVIEGHDPKPLIVHVTG